MDSDQDQKAVGIHPADFSQENHSCRVGIDVRGAARTLPDSSFRRAAWPPFDSSVRCTHMSLKRLSSWQSIAVMIPGALIAVFLVVGVMRSKPGSWRSTGQPQPGTVVSYGLSPAGLGNSCGGVAVVKLKDGALVRAASFQGSFLQSGAAVTVIKHRSTCPPALYTVLHDGPPDSSSSRALAPQRGVSAG